MTLSALAPSRPCLTRAWPRSVLAAVIAAAVLLAVGATAASADTHAGPWPQHDGDSHMTRAGTVAGPDDPGLAWYVDLEEVETDLAPEGYELQGRDQQPTLGPDGRVLVIARNNEPAEEVANRHTLVALEAEDGTVAWEVPGVDIGTFSRRCTQAVDSQGRIWIDHDDGDTEGLQAVSADGELEDRIEGAHRCQDSHVRIGGDPEHLVSIDARTSGGIAAYDLSDGPPSESFAHDFDEIGAGDYVPPGDVTHAAFRGSSLYVVLLDEADEEDPTLELVELDLTDGNVQDTLALPVEPDEDGDGDAGDIARVQLAQPDADSLVVGLARGTGGDARGSVLRVDLAAMELAWSDPFVDERGPHQLAIGHDVVMAKFHSTRRLRALSLDDGSVAWEDESGRGAPSGRAWQGLVADAAGDAYASVTEEGGTSREVASFDAGGQLRWTISAGAITAAAEETVDYPVSLTNHVHYGPIDAEGRLYLTGDNQSNVVALDDSGGLVAPPEPDDPVEAPDERIGAAGRIETSVELSRQFASADTVVLATAFDYPDALAGAPLAVQEGAPILLTVSDGVSAPVIEEINRLGASQAILLGGEAALSQGVEDGLRAHGVTDIVRYAGANRFDTARQIAADLDDPGGRAYVVEGANPDEARGWPDAVAVSALAAHEGVPILLAVTGDLTDPTRTALGQLGTDEATIIGGEAAVGSGVESELSGRGIATDRVFGSGRYDTSAQLANRSVAAGMDPGVVYLATGGNWPDSLSAAPVAGATAADLAVRGGVLLLVDGRDLSFSPAGADWLQANAGDIDAVTAVGGEGAVSSKVLVDAQHFADVD